MGARSSGVLIGISCGAGTAPEVVEKESEQSGPHGVGLGLRLAFGMSLTAYALAARGLDSSIEFLLYVPLRAHGFSLSFRPLSTMGLSPVSFFL